MDYSGIITDLKLKQIRELSNKTNSAVFTAVREDGAVFVMRIYEREIAAYRMLAGKDLSGIPKVYQCYDTQGYFLVEEEYIDGISLQEMIDGGERMEEARAAALISSLCRTLSELHAMGIIHRDVKPEHILLTPEGNVYLIDFDAAMQLSLEKQSDTCLLGTAIYAAPEQFGLTRSDVRTDIFAVGISLNILLTGAHPAVEQYRKGDLAEIIAKCTEMNPARRYQSADALLFDLEHAALSDKRAKRLHTRRIAAGIAGTLLLIFGILLFDRFYYPTVEFQNFTPSDSICILCTKESGNTYQPLAAAFLENTSSETPAQIYLAEKKDRTFYILYRNDAGKLELPILDFYREKTGENLNAETAQNGTIKIGNVRYFIWKVVIDGGFEGAARVGVAFDGELVEYNYGDSEDTIRTKFLWILDETYEEENFLAEHNGDLIPCEEDISGKRYNSTGGLSASDAVLGTKQGELFTKHINLSRAPGDDANAFYLVHPKGTEITETSKRLHAFGQDTSGYGGEGAGGRFTEKLEADLYDLRHVGTVTIAGQERLVTRVTLRRYLGHQEIETTFGLLDTDSGNTVSGFAGVRLVMGMNLVIEAESGDLPDAEAAGINNLSYLREKALGFEPETKPLTFVESADGKRYEAFFPKACAVISDEGQGRLFDISVSPQKGWELSAITDRNGNAAAYIANEREDYILLDAGGQPIYDAGEIFANGWMYGMTGASVNGSEDRTMIDINTCVRAQQEDYAEALRFTMPGSSSRDLFARFLRGKDQNGDPRNVRKCLEYTSYTIYFDPADDAAQNEIVFHLKRTGS